MDLVSDAAYNICFLDYRLGERTGLELLEKMRQKGCRLPIALLAGEGDRGMDLLAMKAGADDYLEKSKIDSSLLGRSIRYAVERSKKEDALRKAYDELEQQVRERTAELTTVKDALQTANSERKQAQEALERSGQHFRSVMDSSIALMGILDRDGILVEANFTALDIAGLSLDDVLGKRFEECYWWAWSPEVQRRLREAVTCAVRGERKRYQEVIRVGAERFRTIDFMLSPICDQGGGVAFLVPSALDITERRRAEDTLQDLEWMFVPKDMTPLVEPVYGDLTELNSERLIMDSVGKVVLNDIANDCLSLLGTSCTIYERNGDYASGIFSSAWCRTLNQASRRLCNTNDNREALRSGKWICHESCKRNALQPCIETGQAVDTECAGGIRLFAEPVLAKGKVIGCITIGYGAPPSDSEKLGDIAQRYEMASDDLLLCAQSYPVRPPFMMEQGKWRVRSMARLIGEVVERKQTEERLRLSQHFLQRILDSSPTLIYIYDLIGQSNVYANLELIHFLGYTPQQAQTMGPELFLNILHPDDATLVAEHHARFSTAREDEVLEVQYRMRHADGQWHWLRSQDVLFARNPEGAAWQILGSAQDITERKQMEDARTFLAHCGWPGSGEEFFPALARYLAETLGMDLVCIDRLVGEGLSARTLAAYQDGRFGDDLEYVLKDTLRGELVGKNLCRYTDGVRHLFPRDAVLQEMMAESGVGTTLWSSMGQPIGLIAVIGRRPLTNPMLVETLMQIVGPRAAGELERRQAEEELHMMKQLAEAASLAKSQFLANMSHEIRTPIGAIRGLTDVALSLEPDKPQKECLLMIKDAAKNLMVIINDLLDISRIEAGKLEMRQEKFDLHALLVTVVNTFWVEAETKGVALRYGISPDVPPLLLGDPSRLRQILMNLIGNALKFTERGEVKVKVEVVEEAEETGADPKALLKLLFSVRDSGLGIPQDKQRMIFDPFRQVDGSLSKKYGGTGLGLAICKRLTEMMRGEIRVESREDQGSTFYFTVVLQRAEGDADSSETGVSANVLCSLGRGPLTILLAEDNPLNQKFLIHLLEITGHSVVAVTNGREAVEMLEKKRFDLVLMDVQMPQVDGIEATRMIRNSRSERIDPRIPIIALTAYAMDGDRERMLAAGMDEYVSKPVEPEEFFRAIHIALTKQGGVRSSLPRQVADSAESVDMASLRARYEGKEDLLKELMDDLQQTVPERLDSLRKALTASDLPAAAKIAHNLAGVAGVFQAPKLLRCARKLEQAGRDGDAAVLSARFDELVGELDVLLAVLDKESKTIGSRSR